MVLILDLKGESIMPQIKEQTLELKNFTKPDETRILPKTKIEIINLGDSTIMRATFQPGWKWTECLKPTVGTESCMVPHLNIIISGRIKITMEDGTEKILGPGDVAAIAPGHTAEVIGNEACVAFDFVGGPAYGKRRK